MEYKFSSYREAVKVAEEADKKLTAYDFKSDEWVLILHEEGTQLFFRSAFVKLWKDWVFIFTEHHKTHVYHKTDLVDFVYFKQQFVDTLKGTGQKDKCYECKAEFDVDYLIYKSHPNKDDPDFIVPLCPVCFTNAEVSSSIE